MLNVRLYVILDREVAGKNPLTELAKAAIAGGATMLQYRDKRVSPVIPTKQSAWRDLAHRPLLKEIPRLTTFPRNDIVDEMVSIGRKIHELTKKARIPLIINDRVDVAVAVGADGVHLGQEDMPIEQARRILGKGKIIGVSVATLGEAKKAEQESADYIGAGPVFATKSKNDAGGPIGIAGLTAIVRSVTIPVVAIGGIHEDNAHLVMEAGVSGIAVLSAVLRAENPQKATKQLKVQISKFKIAE